jgi:cyclopropane fatty-acyl-phospholipid synthase-like methyltransferase
MQVPSSAAEEETEWKTLDLYCDADYTYDLDGLGMPDWAVGEGRGELPGALYDEIHAYEVLEHFGKQGDARAFFRHFNALHRALKPEGFLIGTSPLPDSIWAWGDPGHTRVITPESLTFLEKERYKQLGSTPMSDYRSLVKDHWWKIVHSQKCEGTFIFGLQKQ